MEYGGNVLSKQIADWTISNGTMDSSGIHLEPNGVAYIELFQKDLQNIPDTMQLYVIMSIGSDFYKPVSYGVLKITTNNDTEITYKVPLIYNLSNACSSIIFTTSSTYKKLEFYFETAQQLDIVDWSLSKPLDAQVDIDLDGIIEEIPKLLADYNISTFTVQQREETIALISANLLSNTDVNGKLQITYVATSACIITLRIKDNLGTELYTPILYEVPKGRGSIGVPHAFLKRQLGIHTFTVTAQCSVGSLTFYTRNVLFTIDAGYLARRTIDIGINIRDITVQKKLGETYPSAMYAIGIDPDGVARARMRPISDAAEIVWEPSYEGETAVDCAIEFDGDFLLNEATGKYSLFCDDAPWLFWITKNGDLVARYGEDETSKIILDTSVTHLSVVRGYKSSKYQEQDQGLIVAYIKNGFAYYRNYCGTLENTTVWEFTKELPSLGSDLTHIQVHRLNDYRVGIVATSALGTKWIISDRMYVGEAFLPEYIYVNLDPLAPVAVSHVDDLPADRTIEVTHSDDFLFVYVKCNYPLVIIGNPFELIVPVDDQYSFVDIGYENDYIYLKLNKPLLSSLYIKHSRVFASKQNSGYLSIPLEDWLVQRLVSYEYDETIDINIVPNISLSTRGLAVIENNYPETIEFNLTPNILSVTHAINELNSTPIETISVNFAPNITMAATFVGVLPV